jgi:hypothetical protein
VTVLVITNEQIEKLKPYVSNVVELANNESDQPLLDAINDVILDNILANNDEPDEFGIWLQKIYDEIFRQNE